MADDVTIITQKEKFFARLNRDLVDSSREAIDPEYFTLLPPEVYSGINSDKNTRIVLAPIAASEYVGPPHIYYNRIEFSVYNTLTVKKGNATKVSEILDQISERLLIELKEEDVIDATLPATGPFTLSIAPSCLLFVGSTIVDYED